MSIRSVLLIVATLAAASGGAASHAAPAQYQCYNFDNLATDASYTVGDVIDTQHARITIKQYVTNGNPATATGRRAESAPSKIAGGDAPEL
ncbi:MAG TPA: hypothetical protein P5528_08540, partial [Steroidobacteraceae bacterium]|nr:hypothetical protein [Steroidobacteraceae bacterium]